MKKYMAFIFMSLRLINAMEDNIKNHESEFEKNYLSIDLKENPELDIYLQEKLLLEEAIKYSLETEEQRQLLKVVTDGQLATWQMLPQEIMVYIFSFIPYSKKHLALINKQSRLLTDEFYFLQTLACKLVKEDLTKAVEKFGYAIETEHKALTIAFLKADIMEKITTNSDFQYVSTENFARAMIKIDPTVAHKIFVKAAQKNNISLVQAFLDAEINVNYASNSLGNNALMEAAHHGHKNIAVLLIEHGADISMPNINGYTPLHFAVMGGYSEIVELLIDKHVYHINAKTHIYNTTPLIIAAKLGHTTIVKLLINNHANVNAEERTKHTALMYASYYGHLEIVKFLLEHGADANVQTRDPKKWTLFDHAIKGECVEICYGYTALMFACEQGHDSITDELLGFSNIHLSNDHNNTALQCASKKYVTYTGPNGDNYKKIIDLLIRNGALIHKKQSRCLLS